MCDGITDDAPALQAKVDAARMPGGRGRPIDLPEGVCILGSTVTVRAVAGMRIRGRGAGPTELRWRGNASSPMLVFDRTRLLSLEDVALSAERPLAEAIRIQQGPSCAEAPVRNCRNWSSSLTSVRNLTIDGHGRIIIGVHVALWGADRKNDSHRFENIELTGYTGSAFVLDGRQSKANTFRDVVCTGGGTGRACVDTAALPGSGGSFWWYGGAATNHKEADFLIGDRNDVIGIFGAYSEKSHRFLRAVHSVHRKVSQPIILSGVRWSSPRGDVAPDGEVIAFDAPGPLLVMGSRFGTTPPNSVVRFGVRTGGSQASGFVFLGNYVGSTDTRIFSGVTPDNCSGSVAIFGTRGHPVTLTSIGDTCASQAPLPGAP